MKVISKDSLLNIIEYEKVRDKYRTDIIHYKKNRRLKIGPNITIVFENQRTLSFQIQEIMRAERMVQDEDIQDEVDIYNSIMPPKDGLSATLFIEVTEEDKIKSVLNQFIGLTSGKTLYLDIDGEKVYAIFEQGREEEDKISSVHYLQFHLTKEQINKIGDSKYRIIIGVNYKGYDFVETLSKAMQVSLYKDTI